MKMLNNFRRNMHAENPPSGLEELNIQKQGLEAAEKKNRVRTKKQFYLGSMYY